jgi:hypothetical protein
LHHIKFSQFHVFRDFSLKIFDEKKVLNNVVSMLRLNGFYNTNLKLFFMVRTKKIIYRSRAMVENNSQTHTSLGPIFLSLQKVDLRIAM